MKFTASTGSVIALALIGVATAAGPIAAREPFPALPPGHPIHPGHPHIGQFETDDFCMARYLEPKFNSVSRRERQAATLTPTGLSRSNTASPFNTAGAVAADGSNNPGNLPPRLR
ncbi:hypothetical protein F5887DRAFT_923019 [Amanita rubescens]|nr:hypothetical protein F5887DRAFT_923019 [Amanita rubescens]